MVRETSCLGHEAFPTKLGGLFNLVAGEFTRQSGQSCESRIIETIEKTLIIEITEKDRSYEAGGRL